jgi:hypothetical protein
MLQIKSTYTSTYVNDIAKDAYKVCEALGRHFVCLRMKNNHGITYGAETANDLLVLE